MAAALVQHQPAHCCHRPVCLHNLLLAVSPCVLQCGWVLLHKWGLVPLHPGLHLLQTCGDRSLGLLQGLQHIPRGAMHRASSTILMVLKHYSSPAQARARMVDGLAPGWCEAPAEPES